MTITSTPPTTTRLAPPATVYGPDEIALEGCVGRRYWVHHPFPFTGHAQVDERLSGYPLAVFVPPNRHPARVPVVVGLQGMAAPYGWNAFLVPTLLDMGLACVLFDTPLAGERSLARAYDGDILHELVPLVELGVPVGTALVSAIVEAVARDFGTVLRLVRERHGVGDCGVALFGVSLGALLSSFAFMRDGIGQRLLGTLGHADLRRFARSYTPALAPLLGSPPARLLAWAAGRWLGPRNQAGLAFLDALGELAADGPASAALDPMTYAERIGPGRRVRFLVGADDPLVRPEDAGRCARRFVDGECYVVPGLAHGTSRTGPSFVEHVRTFLRTQLGDWGGCGQ